MSEHIAGGAAGLGAGEVQRRELTPAEVEAIVRTVIEEHREFDGEPALDWGVHTLPAIAAKAFTTKG